MNNLTRTDTLFGRRVNMVGNISADLVLESLGKIYIKSRNKSLTLEEVITSLVMEDPNTSTSRCKVVEGIEGLDTSEFKNGTFVFDKLSNILYLFIDDELLELINVAPEGTGFVKRSGDTMTGRLAIYVKNGPPLYVNSSDLVQNLNAQYLNGETAEEFTRRNADEKIGGEWTFLRPTTFESGVLFYKDIITHGSIGTPSFSSGFGGYGWRMDADTNTLTVDNLVVRKLMRVYELVVNKISATNGSLWVTNAGKVTSVIKLQIKTPDFFNTSSSEYKKFAGGLKQGDAFIKTGTVTIRDFSENDQDPNEPFMTASGNGVQIKLNCWTVNSLKAAKLIMPIKKGVDYSLQTFNAQDPLDYNEVPLFDTDFRFDCTFPIVTDLGYITYKRAKDLLIDAYKELLVLQGLSNPTSELSQLIDLLLAQINGPTEGLKSITNPYKYIKYVLPYYKYFAKGDYYLVGFDSDELPVFKPGDLLRCQKWTYNGIKYYDAIVCNLIDTRYVIQLADSMLDKKTTINYNSSLEPEVTIHEEEENTNLYNTSKRNSNPMDDPIGIVEEKDGLVQMGHLWDSQRQNAVYITSTDDGAPFMDVLSGINRPDFSVIYYTPIFQTIKLYAKAKGPRRFREGGQLLNDKVEGIPATKEYYVQRDGTTSGDYTYIRVTGNDETEYYMVKGYHPAIQCADNGYSCTILNYLNLSPDKNTKLILESTKRYLLLENGAHLDIGTYVLSNVPTEGKHFLLEAISDKFQLASTRTTRARLGNLEGILDEMFPLDKLPYGYGLYGQNVFLTGEFYLSNGTAVADIGKDAITFAIAGLTALENSITLLRQDTEAAYNLLKSNVYSKGLLRTAGMVVRGGDNPGIVMWGNSIIIATTKEELYGLAEPTALFNNGKIRAKFLEIHDAYSDEVYQYESIPQQYKLELSNRNWTEINYSASGTNLSDTSPSTSGGVKIYTYKNNGKDVTLYIRLFTIHSLRTNISDYAVLNNKYNDSESEYYVTPEGPYDAWLVVNLDGDISDISNLQYATFLIDDVEYSGDSRDPNSVFNVSSKDFDKVLKNVTLWSLRADGTGNLGGRSVFWNTLGDLSVIGSLNSARGSFAKFLYYKNDIYSLLDPGYAGEYPKFLIHNDKLSSALLIVEYESASFDSGYLIQLGYSRLNANQLHILKGYYDYINLSNNEGVLYEKDSITMGVLYPLLNLMVIPYRSDKLKFFVICNYVPLITKVDVYYLVAGTYYIALNCTPSFEFFIQNNYLTGNILTCISGINNMYGGLGYFRNESQRVVANLAGLNIGNTFNFGESSSNYVYVGGSENWWYIEAKKKKEVEDSGTSVENIHDISAKSLGNKQVKLDNHIIAFKIETINEDKHTEGGFSFLLSYNSFADKIIEYVPPMSNDNYEEDVLLKWVKEPYTLLLGNFKLRYISICGDEDTSGTLRYYVKYMNQEILEDNASASTIQLPAINESSLNLQLLDNVITDITNEALRLSNNYIDSLTDSNHSSSNNVLTVSGKVSSFTGNLYSLLWNNESLLDTEDYTREKTLTGLSPITYINPKLSSFKSSGSVTLQQGALLLRSFVERECEYIDKYLLFLDKLRFNIQNSKTPDISVSTVYITADRSTGTKSFTVTADSNINWTVSTNSNWCFAGVVSSGGLLVSNGSGNLTVEIRYYVNNDYNSRTSIITVKGGDTIVKVTFVQEAKTYKEYILSVSPSSISVPASGGSYTLNVTSNDRWTIIGYPNWATFTPMSGSGNGTISVQVTSSSTSRLTPVSMMMIDDYSKTANFTINLAGSGSSSTTEIVYSGQDTPAAEEIIITSGSSNSLSGNPLYSIGLISDLHLNYQDDRDGTKDKESGLYYDEEDLAKVLQILKSKEVSFICGCGDITEASPYYQDKLEVISDSEYNYLNKDVPDSVEPYKVKSKDAMFDDADNFYDVYTKNCNGLNFYTPLGNHDFRGLYEALSTDTTNTSNSNETANGSTNKGFNEGVYDRITNIWFEKVHNSAIIGNRSIHYFRYNNSGHGNGITNLSGWNYDEGGVLNNYSKLNFWFDQSSSNSKKDRYIFMSIDYGNDLYKGGNGKHDWHNRKIRARNIINGSDTYITAMKTYAAEGGYNNNDTYDYQFYHPNVLIWLKEIIEDSQSDETINNIYVFSHHFLPNKVGNNLNLPKDGYWGYGFANTITTSATETWAWNGATPIINIEGKQDKDLGKLEGASYLSGVQFYFLNRLNNLYKNVIFFSGHSHITWTKNKNNNNESTHVTSGKDYDFYKEGDNGVTEHTIYTRKSNNSSQVTGGNWVALPAGCKPSYGDEPSKGSANTHRDEAEFTIMEIYENGVKLKGYNMVRTEVSTGGGSVGNIPIYESNSTGDARIRFINGMEDGEDAWLNGKLSVYFFNDSSSAGNGVTGSVNRDNNIILGKVCGAGNPNLANWDYQATTTPNESTAQAGGGGQDYVMKYADDKNGNNYYVSGSYSNKDGAYILNKIRLKTNEYVEAKIPNEFIGKYFGTWEKITAETGSNPAIKLACTNYGYHGSDKHRITDAEIKEYTNKSTTWGEYYAWKDKYWPVDTGPNLVVKPIKNSDGIAIKVETGKTYYAVITGYTASVTPLATNHYRISHNEQWPDYNLNQIEEGTHVTGYGKLETNN